MNVKRFYKLALPFKEQLGPLFEMNSQILEYDDIAEELIIRGKLEENLARSLMKPFKDPGEREVVVVN